MTGPQPPNAADNGAAALLRAVDLMGDGPVVWGRPVATRGPGVFVVELPATRATAPLELARIGKWLERVPDLRLDGERPTSRALAARVASKSFTTSPTTGPRSKKAWSSSATS